MIFANGSCQNLAVFISVILNIPFYYNLKKLNFQQGLLQEEKYKILVDIIGNLSLCVSYAVLNTNLWMKIIPKV